MWKVLAVTKNWNNVTPTENTSHIPENAIDGADCIKSNEILLYLIDYIEYWNKIIFILLYEKS